MIARLHILLPYSLSVPTGQKLLPDEIEIEEYTARVYPPYKSQVDRSVLQPDSPDSQGALIDLGAQLKPAEPQPSTAMILVDGRESIQADALQVDFIRDEFDRRIVAEDPLVELGFRVANGLLARLRTLGRAGQVKSVSPTSTVWRIQYLNDDGSELEPVEGLRRGLGGATWHFAVAGLPEDLWTAALGLPDVTPTPWDTLLLDALDLLPDVGPAIVLAFAAIETRIESALDVLSQQTGLDEELWTWIKDREGDYRREPSITERLDPLLKGLSGRSLKDDARLWEAFQNLRKARNSFVHEGQAMIGGEPATYERVSGLVALAGDIIDWIEGLLPEDQRRPRYAREGVGLLEITKIVARGQVALAEPEAEPDD